MKRLRLSLKVLGIFFAAIGITNSSCEKDEDDECITCTYDGEKETMCKGDKDEWEEYADSWSEFQDYVREMDDQLENMTCKGDLGEADKDDDVECVTCTYTDYGETETYRWCEDEKLGEEGWGEYADTWSEFKTYVFAYASYDDDVDCELD